MIYFTRNSCENSEKKIFRLTLIGFPLNLADEQKISRY